MFRCNRSSALVFGRNTTQPIEFPLLSIVFVVIIPHLLGSSGRLAEGHGRPLGSFCLSTPTALTAEAEPTLI